MSLHNINMLTSHGKQCGIAPMTQEDFQRADAIYREILPKLDPLRPHVSLNYKILAAELLRRIGKYAYSTEIYRFTGVKGQFYQDVIDQMWNAAFPDGYNEKAPEACGDHC